jgi:hypothetical protein
MGERRLAVSDPWMLVLGIVGFVALLLLVARGGGGG